MLENQDAIISIVVLVGGALAAIVVFWKNLLDVLLKLRDLRSGKKSASDKNTHPPVSEEISDLIISPLESNNSLTPQDGHPVINENGVSIFTGGVRAEFILSHNNKSSGKILLRRIAINVEKFEAGQNEDLSYQIKGEEISGAGLLSPDQFYISLFGKEAGYAKWIRSDGSSVQSKNKNNFLDTVDPKYITLQALSDDIVSININISAQEVGYYELSITFDYLVGGKESSKTEGLIHLYFER